MKKIKRSFQLLTSILSFIVSLFLILYSTAGIIQFLSYENEDGYAYGYTYSSNVNNATIVTDWSEYIGYDLYDVYNNREYIGEIIFAYEDYSIIYNSGEYKAYNISGTVIYGGSGYIDCHELFLDEIEPININNLSYYENFWLANIGYNINPTMLGIIEAADSSCIRATYDSVDTVYTFASTYVFFAYTDDYFNYVFACGSGLIEYEFDTPYIDSSYIGYEVYYDNGETYQVTGVGTVYLVVESADGDVYKVTEDMIIGVYEDDTIEIYEYDFKSYNNIQNSFGGGSFGGGEFIGDIATGSAGGILSFIFTLILGIMGVVLSGLTFKNPSKKIKNTNYTASVVMIMITTVLQSVCAMLSLVAIAMVLHSSALIMQMCFSFAYMLIPLVIIFSIVTLCVGNKKEVEEILYDEEMELQNKIDYNIRMILKLTQDRVFTFEEARKLIFEQLK